MGRPRTRSQSAWDEHKRKVKPSPSDAKRRPVVSYTIKGTQKLFGAGYGTLVKCPKSEKGQRVAEISYLVKDTSVKGKVKVQVSWYYWPHETAAGKQPFFGDKEIIKVDESDIVSADDILDVCYVHDLDDYTNLEHVGPQDYFVRFEFCKCEIPVNPDQFMLKCDACQNLYHPSCIGMTIEAAEQLDIFVEHKRAALGVV